MKIRYLLTFSAVVYLLFGLASLFLPQEVFSLYGMLLDQVSVFFAQISGAAFVSFALLNWNFRILIDPVKIKPIIAANFTFNFVTFIAILKITTAGVMNWLGWFSFSLHLILTFAFAYFILLNKSE